jgi:hypothetical protein
MLTTRPRERSKHPPASRARQFELDPLAGDSTVAQVLGCEALQATIRVPPDIEVPGLEGKTKAAPKLVVQAAEKNDLAILFAAFAVQRHDHVGHRDELEAQRLVKPGARDVQVGVSPRLQPLKGVEREILGRNGLCDLGGPRLYPAAMRCDDSEGRPRPASEDPEVDSDPFIPGERLEVRVFVCRKKF